ncbi:unnamed protein product [Rhizophagus irregularis]|uniref:DUF659 domain-containing protein n=1 Tax=Rhizophagus irregularis TaxID=588596 RepID=A0A915ZKR9_9GLOM|nr:unnamed protein product [Rhizophagus irregularis]
MSSTELEKNINLPTTKTNKKSTNKKSTNKKSGRPFSEIWKNDMKRGEPRGDVHLTKCNLAPNEVREYWKKELYGTEEENSTDSDTEIPNSANCKRKKNFNKKINKKFRVDKLHQSDIRNHVTNTNNELEISTVNIIDKALLNAFVCCGIPFKVIKNPFFLELLKILQPLYNPPTRQRLSDSLLKYESGRIENKINHKLDRGENYTLAIDGWSDPRNKSIWGFMILTPDRQM